MKSSNPTLDALLASGNAVCAEIFRLTLASGEVLRYTTADRKVVYDGNTYLHDGPVLTRGGVSSRCGLEVVKMPFTIAPKSTDLLLGLKWPEAARVGVLDDAELLVNRVFYAAWGQAAAGALYIHDGKLSEPVFGRGILDFLVENDLKLLNVKMPRVLDQPGCRHELFNADCGLNKASFEVSSSVQSGSTALVLNCGVTDPAGWFDLGTIEFTSGANNGVKRSIRKYTPGSPAALLLLTPLPVVPSVSDTFKAYPGCDKLQATCDGKFDNLDNFGGEPYIPRPETAV